MAGDWIKFELITLDKPEVCQIADYAAIDPDAVVGKLLRVWGWFDQHTENGNAPSVSKKLLDRLVGVPDFCEFMILVGWMIEVEDDAGHHITLPNFDRHNGGTAKKRLLTAKRVASHKASTGKTNAKGNAGSVSGALPREDVDVDKNQQQARDARQRFEMHEAWQPDEMSLKTQLKLAGLQASAVTAEVVREFIGYWLNRETADNQGGWCQRLVKHAKAQATKAAGKPQQQAPQADWADEGVIL